MPRTDEVRPTRRTTARVSGSGNTGNRILRLIQKRAQFFVEAKETASEIAKQSTAARDELIELVAQIGNMDDKGSSWVTLLEPIKFTNEKGQVYNYTHLKRERHLSPANPLPISEKAEELLKKKKLWVKPRDQQAIDDIQDRYPFLKIEINVNVDALATQGYFGNLVSESEYNSLLPKQVESFQFKPVEA